MKYNLAVLFFACSFVAGESVDGRPNRGVFHHRPTTIEKERPELNEDTKRLIAEYRRNPTNENYARLRRQVEANYDRVIARKKAKLEELRKTARHEFLVKDMEKIVDEVIRERERRVEQSMRRFTDARLRPGVRENKDGFLPVIGAETRISIAYTPVTNAEYARFVRENGRKMSGRRKNGKITVDKKLHPVVNVSFDDAVKYCKWLSAETGVTYRLPTAEEWEYAAGHMPKDADFNNGENESTTPVNRYASTLSACGAIDMWGNCREWTSTGDYNGLQVKGGSFKSSRMDCRTENRHDTRRGSERYDDVGFRIVRED